jgi:uncharacterized coiled-coil protein SlyX
MMSDDGKNWWELLGYAPIWAPIGGVFAFLGGFLRGRPRRAAGDDTAGLIRSLIDLATTHAATMERMERKLDALPDCSLCASKVRAKLDDLHERLAAVEQRT